MAEAGVPGYEMSAWVGVMAPAGTPKDVVGQDAANARASAAGSRGGIARSAAWAWSPAASKPAEFTAYLAKERSQYKRLVDAGGITISNQ